MQNQFITLYNETSQLIAQHSAPVLNPLRAEAARRLEQNGFPTRRTEEYLYCPLFNALKTDWGVNLNRITFGMKPEELFHCAVPGFKSTMAYVVNDVWHNSTPVIELGNGAFITSLTTACEKYPELVERHFGKQIAGDSNDAFDQLNMMLAQDGLFIYVPKNVEVQMPLQVIYLMRAAQSLMAHNRNIIVLEDNAQLNYLDCDHSMDSERYFAMRLTEIYVGAGARLNYYVMESTHTNMNNLRKYVVSQQRDSQLSMDFFGLNNGNTRNDVIVNLDGEGAQTRLGGMLLADKEQRCENYTIIRHNVPNCKSEELYKYILDDSAEAGFSGRIVVKEGAQKTESYQTNRNICLSKDARALGRPQLEIYADDVKCGHGATTGMLDEKALFYMQQRGIGLKEARLLLLQAFATEVLDHINVEPLRDRLRMMTEKRLRGEDFHCAGCMKH